MTRVGVFPAASSLSCVISAGFHSFPWFFGVFMASSGVGRMVTLAHHSSLKSITID